MKMYYYLLLVDYYNSLELSSKCEPVWLQMKLITVILVENLKMICYKNRTFWSGSVDLIDHQQYHLHCLILLHWSTYHWCAFCATVFFATKHSAACWINSWFDSAKWLASSTKPWRLHGLGLSNAISCDSEGLNLKYVDDGSKSCKTVWTAAMTRGEIWDIFILLPWIPRA